MDSPTEARKECEECGGDMLLHEYTRFRRRKIETVVVAVCPYDLSIEQNREVMER